MNVKRGLFPLAGFLETLHGSRFIFTHDLQSTNRYQ